MKKSVLIVAAGAGSRMGGTTPKQYLQLQGKPVIIHTIERFLQFDPEMNLVVVLSPQHRELWEKVSKAYKLPDRLRSTTGGATRFDSVKKGLEHVGHDELVGIHDAVRPFVSTETLKRCYDIAARDGSGIPVLEMEESVRMLDARGGSRPLDRSMVKRVQTPQVFQAELIMKAYSQPFRREFTDDASVYEAANGPVRLVEGNPENIKITTPMDLLIAERIMGSPY